MSAHFIEPPLLLMTPGPTRVPERVLRAGGRPMIHHRTPEFCAELGAMLEMLQPVFGTRNPVLPVHTSGRGALEAAICNLFSPGDEIAICCNGKFGEMWSELAESYGLIVHRFASDWSSDIDLVELEQVLAGTAKGELRTANVKAVALAYCDTSSGVRNDIEAVGKVARAHGAMLMVDAVSALGGMPFAFDEWEVDFAATASQKCLMSSPGLSFAVLSGRAWKANATARIPRNYWDFLDIRNCVTKPIPDTPSTAPVHLVLQVTEALRMVHEEGLGAVQQRHEAMAAEARRGAAALGLSLQCPTFRRYSPTVTAIALPADVNPKALREQIKARGVLVAAGLGEFEAAGFRIGHMGDIRLADVERTIRAVGESLDVLRA